MAAVYSRTPGILMAGDEKGEKSTENCTEHKLEKQYEKKTKQSKELGVEINSATEVIYWHPT